jgi:hypothetical protein
MVKPSPSDLFMSAVRLTSGLWGLHPQSYDRIHGQTLMALTHLQRRHFKLRRLLGSSHEVLIPYSANNLSPLTRVYLTRYVPLTGFLNLLAAYSSDCAMVLFHTMSTHGICSAELSP